jgi:hypothetical protein
MARIKSTEAAYRRACRDTCDITISALREGEASLLRVIEHAAGKAFAAGVLWVVARNPSSEDEALLRKLALITAQGSFSAETTPSGRGSPRAKRGT